MRISKVTRLIPRPTFGRVVGGAAVLVLLGAGTAYAANEYTGANIVNASLTTVDYKNDDILGIDIKNATITAADLAVDSVNSTKIVNGTILAGDLAGNSVNSTKVVDGSLTGADVADGSLDGTDVSQLDGDLDIIDNTITTFDIATDAVDSDEVLDFGLSNQDVGVLFAQINGDASVNSSSGSVTSIALGTGTYEVDFGRDISACAFTATQGEGGIGSASGAVMGVTDRAGDPNAIFVTARTPSTNALVNTAFQLVVVC